MGFFSIIETFFFISLGITIVLVALLVYHFKQRVCSLEQKYESLFDIVSGVVKQLSNIQHSTSISQPKMGHFVKISENTDSEYKENSGDQFSKQVCGLYPNWVNPPHLGNNLEYYPKIININEDLQYNLHSPKVNSSINVNNIDKESESESESDEDIDNESDEEESDNNSEKNESDDNSSTILENAVEGLSINDLSLQDNTLSFDADANEDNVKIINLNVIDNHTNECKTTSTNLEGGVGCNVDSNPDSGLRSNKESVDNTNESLLQDIKFANNIVRKGVDDQSQSGERSLNDIDHSVSSEEDNAIVVLKIANNEDEQVNINVEKPTSKDLYKKMTLSHLKATVIAKGLCSDPSKMKKNELLKLLEDE